MSVENDRLAQVRTTAARQPAHRRDLRFEVPHGKEKLDHWGPTAGCSPPTSLSGSSCCVTTLTSQVR
jgi:hypothetical protein